MSWFKKKIQSGALLDNRAPEEKNKDYQFKELVSSTNPVNWVEKSEYRRFPIYNQDGSGSCVAQTMAKMLGIIYWLKNGQYVHFSATDLYQRRSNAPQGGMAGIEAFKLAQEGVTLEELVPSQNLSDAQMDGYKIEQYKRDVGSVFKIGNYIIAPVKDIETIASIIQTTGKGVMVWFYFNHDEWTNTPTIKEPTLDLLAASRHSVTAVDFTLYQGKKALIIEDSWGTSYGMAGQRIITEDFYKARNWFAGYVMNFKFDEPILKPTGFTFTKQLKFGMTNLDVKMLQDCLKYEKLFPNNTESTGYFGSITKNAVIAFQIKYGIDPVGEVGSITRAKLNELFR